jgi:hypothetical protein
MITVHKKRASLVEKKHKSTLAPFNTFNAKISVVTKTTGSYRLTFSIIPSVPVSGTSTHSSALGTIHVQSSDWPIVKSDITYWVTITDWDHNPII